MIDHHYSKEAFESAGWNSEESRRLSGKLNVEIRTELQHILEPAFIAIIKQLNEMGHRLIPSGLGAPGEMKFVEPYTGDEVRSYKMMVAFDLILTIGYPRSEREPFAD